jgi:hypothetical protein
LRTMLRGKISLLFLTIAVLIAVPAIAFAADQVNADGDGLAAPITNQDMAAGSVPCNVATKKTALIALEHRGGG